MGLCRFPLHSAAGLPVAESTGMHSVSRRCARDASALQYALLLKGMVAGYANASGFYSAIIVDGLRCMLCAPVATTRVWPESIAHAGRFCSLRPCGTIAPLPPLLFDSVT